MKVNDWGSGVLSSSSIHFRARKAFLKVTPPGRIETQSRTLDHGWKTRAKLGRTQLGPKYDLNLSEVWQSNCFYILVTVSTTSIENIWSLFLQRCPSLESICLTTSIGVCKHSDWHVLKATATRENMASMSSWVWPTCRWWHDATPHKPAWTILVNIFAPYWLRSSLTVLSDWSHSLR